MMAVMRDFTARVEHGLGELRRHDPNGKKVFGADTHRYLLQPPVHETVVAAFERKHSIRLPADYRAFLAELGNGGAGPYYGVFRLGEMDDNFDCKPWEVGELVGAPAKSFPHKEQWNLSADELERIQDSDDDDEILRTYWTPVEGAIPLCHRGCALRDWLAVSGPEAGHVWHDATADFAGWSPHALPGGGHMTFADWYVAWLDKALQSAHGAS
jgi:SMI1/KNR4 family protein SUKH-1